MARPARLVRFLLDHGRQKIGGASSLLTHQAKTGTTRAGNCHRLLPARTELQQRRRISGRSIYRIGQVRSGRLIMADVQPGAGPGPGGPGPAASASPDRSQGGNSQASITPPSAPGANTSATSPTTTTNNAGQALAAAQLSTMSARAAATGGGGGGTRRRDPAQDEAVLGVAAAGAYEALDEGGEMVRVRFLDFLSTL